MSFPTGVITPAGDPGAPPPQDPNIGNPPPSDDPPAGDPPAGDPGGAVLQDDGSYEWPDGYRVDADGNHFDAEGNPVEETPPAGDPPPAKPAAPAAQPKPAEPREPVQPREQFVPETADDLLTEEARRELADLDVSNPARAHAIRTRVWQQYELQADDSFDEQVDEFAQEAPEIYQAFQREFDRARRRMNPQQKQQPGAARSIAALLIAEDIIKNGVSVVAKYAGSAPSAPAPPAGPKRRDALPPEERTPRPAGGTRREVPQRNAQGGGAGDSRERELEKLYPDMTPAERKEFLRSADAMEAEAGKRR